MVANLTPRRMRFGLSEGMVVLAAGSSGKDILILEPRSGRTTRDAREVSPCSASAAELVDRIDERLPQIQCRRCGYSGHRPYAEAIARGEANINRCPPGGSATIAGLARLLGVSEVELDEACGGK